MLSGVDLPPSHDLAKPKAATPLLRALLSELSGRNRPPNPNPNSLTEDSDLDAPVRTRLSDFYYW
jgi:hypothetical protein